jgi:FixJ family two-component response regulator
MRNYVIGIVDDDASILRALKRLLSAAGFAVQTFASGEEFLAASAASELDCVLLDIHLPGMSGFEVQQRLAAAGRCIPTVFITAHHDMLTDEDSPRVNSSHYLRKPVDEETLLGAINDALAVA